jgi:hypothetical protein
MASLVVRDLLAMTGADALAHVRSLREGAANNAAFATWLESLPAPEAPARGGGAAA